MEALIPISSQEIALEALFSFFEGQKLPSPIFELLLLEQLLRVCSGNSTPQLPAGIFVTVVILFTCS